MKEMHRGEMVEVEWVGEGLNEGKFELEACVYIVGGFGGWL